MNKKVGLLLPKSVLYPTINFDIVAGLKYGLVESGITDVEIKTENIGIAGDNKLIFSSAEKLVFEGCTVIVGYVNPSSAEKLEELCANANVIFISLDSGYHYPSSMKKSEHIFYISLQGALGCRVVARTALEEGKKKFAFTGSFYDAGYRSPHALTSAVEEGDGSITHNHITLLKRADFTIGPLAAHLRTGEPDAVLAAFCGDMMQDFFAGAAAENIFESHPAYCSPFMGDEQWLAQSPYPGRDLKTCVSWVAGLDNAANRQFTKTLIENKQRPNIFSELSMEAGLVIASALNAGDVDTAINALEGMQYAGPRGQVTINAATHTAYAPIYEAWIRKNEDTGNCRLEIIRESPYTEQQRQKLEHDINNFTGSATSWHNAYGCLDS